jgi:hypothetical protein
MPPLRCTRVLASARALGTEVVFAGDPAGAPAELEVAVYKPFGKEGRAVPLG